MMLQCVRVKEEQLEGVGEWEAKEEALAILYEGHEIKNEMVVGPDLLQLPVFSVESTNNIEEVFIKSEPVQLTSNAIKTEPNELTMNSVQNFQTEVKMEPLAIETRSPNLRDVIYKDCKLKPCTIRLERLKPHKCMSCLKLFHDNISLVRHAETSEACSIVLYDKGFFCDLCCQQFTRKSGLASHMHTHYKPILTYAELVSCKVETEIPNRYACRICKRKFRVYTNLIQHEDKHANEEPFVCEICKKVFVLEKYLIWHMPVHTGEKPFPCKICDKRFKRSSNLASHMHSHTGLKFACDVCKKQFNRSSNLHAHVRIHATEKPFACPICKKEFTQKLHLDRHEKVHNRAFSCDVCYYKFKAQFELTRHVKTYHKNEKSLSCEVCRKQFVNSRNLIVHRMKAHGKRS